MAVLADAVLLASGIPSIDIGGSLILKGGTSTRLGSAVVAPLLTRSNSSSRRAGMWSWKREQAPIPMRKSSTRARLF